MTLLELFESDHVRYQTDKHTNHRYFTIYDPLFGPFQHEPIGVFEVGAHWGGSAALWDDYFDHPDAKIRTIDIRHFPEFDERILTDRTRLDFIDINDLTPEYFDFPVDIAIDDGSHTLSDQITFVELLYPIVRKGGMLIIEDIQDLNKTTKAMRKLGHPFFIVDLNHLNNWNDSFLFIFMK